MRAALTSLEYLAAGLNTISKVPIDQVLISDPCSADIFSIKKFKPRITRMLTDYQIQFAQNNRMPVQAILAILLMNSPIPRRK